MEGPQEMEETAFWETEKMMEVLVPGEWRRWRLRGLGPSMAA